MSYPGILSKYLRERDRGLILLLCAAVFAVYLPFLGSPFIFDDLNFFKSGEAERYSSSVFHLNLRWLPYATLGWTYALFSDVDTYAYHLGNMLLHIGNAILLFYLLRRLVFTAMPEHERSPRLVWGAWLGALVYACHPVAVYAVGYVIERSILMATMFALAMQLAYLKGLLCGQKRWLVVAVAAYFIAGFSKEHSVMAPAILLALHVMLRDRDLPVGKAVLAATWIAFCAIGLMLVLISKGVIGSAYEPFAAIIFNQQGMVASGAMLHLLSALTQAGLFFKYLLLWLLPNPGWMSIDMREHFIGSLGEWPAWAGGTAFIGYGVFAVRMLFQPGWRGMLGLALLYPWLQYGVEMVAVRVQEPFVLYRSYLWMPGLMLIFPWMAIRFPNHRWVTAAVLVVLLVPLAWNRLWMMGDPYRLWNEAVMQLSSDKVIGADRDYYNRGEALALQGKWPEAAADFEKAVSLSPEFAQIHKELAVAYANLGRYPDALTQLDEAIRLQPRFAVAYYYKGMVLKKMHQNDQAIDQMVKSCELGYSMACFIVRMAPAKK